MINLTLFTQKIEEFVTFLDIEKNLSKHTLRAYQSDLEQIKDFWDRIATKEKTIKHQFNQIINRYTVSLFYEKLSKRSLARKFSSLRSFVAFLKMNGINIKLDIKSPRLDKKLPTILSVEEVTYLLDTIKIEELPSKFPFRDKAIFEMLYATGMRCSELVNLALEDIDFDEMSIRIHGKGRRERIALFGSKAGKALERYLLEERQEILKKQKNNHVFLNYQGTQITSRSVQRVIGMFRKFLKIDKNLTPHKIRHSFASHLLSQGVNLRVIQELLGHKTIATTEIYTQISNKQLKEMCDEKHPLADMDL